MNLNVSYIENFAKHFNLPVKKLLKLAAEVTPDFDSAFVLDMMDRFELDPKKKFNHLSLGMKTMISTIITLASEKEVILLDEPVLGFDAIMRMELYQMLSDSFERHPRIIIVSTHIIEEIAKTIESLIIIDKGKLLFFGSLETIEQKAFILTGFKEEVEETIKTMNIINLETRGGLSTAYIFDTPPINTKLTIAPLSLQEFFIQMATKER